MVLLYSEVEHFPASKCINSVSSLVMFRDALFNNIVSQSLVTSLFPSSHHPFPVYLIETVFKLKSLKKLTQLRNLTLNSSFTPHFDLSLSFSFTIFNPKAPVIRNVGDSTLLPKFLMSYPNLLNKTSPFHFCV